MKRTVNVNRYYNKRGNSYATKNVTQCAEEVCKKLKVSVRPDFGDWFTNTEHVLKSISIRKQVEEQYDCNQRRISFKIEI